MTRELQNTRLGFIAAFLSIFFANPLCAACDPPGCPAGTSCTVEEARLCAGRRCIQNELTLEFQCNTYNCTDNIKNGWESGRDCGGDCPGRCPPGMPCYSAFDCADGICKFENAHAPYVYSGIGGGNCVAPTCSDAVANGLEVDIDCGAAGCCAAYANKRDCPKRCPAGYRCSSLTDCKDERCYRNSKMNDERFCAAPRLTDLYPQYSSRVDGGILLPGAQKHNLDTDKFFSVLSFMLDVPIESLAMDVLVDLYEAQEIGNDTYIELRYKKGWMPNGVSPLIRRRMQVANANSSMPKFRTAPFSPFTPESSSHNSSFTEHSGLRLDTSFGSIGWLPSPSLIVYPGQNPPSSTPGSFKLPDLPGMYTTLERKIYENYGKMGLLLYKQAQADSFDSETGEYLGDLSAALLKGDEPPIKAMLHDMERLQQEKLRKRIRGSAASMSKSSLDSALQDFPSLSREPVRDHEAGSVGDLVYSNVPPYDFLPAYAEDDWEFDDRFLQAVDDDMMDDEYVPPNFDSYPKYHLSLADHRLATEIRFVAYTFPPEALLIQRRMNKLLDLQLLPGGWAAERALQDELETIALDESYCLWFGMRYPLNDFNLTSVDCSPWIECEDTEEEGHISGPQIVESNEGLHGNGFTYKYAFNATTNSTIISKCSRTVALKPYPYIHRGDEINYQYRRLDSSTQGRGSDAHANRQGKFAPPNSSPPPSRYVEAPPLPEVFRVDERPQYLKSAEIQTELRRQIARECRPRLLYIFENAYYETLLTLKEKLDAFDAQIIRPEEKMQKQKQSYLNDLTTDPATNTLSGALLWLSPNNDKKQREDEVSPLTETTNLIASLLLELKEVAGSESFLELFAYSLRVYLGLQPEGYLPAYAPTDYVGMRSVLDASMKHWKLVLLALETKHGWSNISREVRRAQYHQYLADTPEWCLHIGDLSAQKLNLFQHLLDSASEKLANETYVPTKPEKPSPSPSPSTASKKSWVRRLNPNIEIAYENEEYAVLRNQYKRDIRRVLNPLFPIASDDNTTAISEDEFDMDLSRDTLLPNARSLFARRLSFSGFDFVDRPSSEWGLLPAIPRVSLASLLVARGIPHDSTTGPQFLEASTLYPESEEPHPFFTPSNIKVYLEPRGTPALPMYHDQPFPIQPVVVLVDRHARILRNFSQTVVVTAYLDRPLFPEEWFYSATPSTTPSAKPQYPTHYEEEWERLQRLYPDGYIYELHPKPLQLLGTTKAVSDKDGYVIFEDLYLTRYVEGVFLNFTATYITVDRQIIALSGNTRPFQVEKAPPKKVIIPYRRILSKGLVIFITVLCVLTVLGIIIGTMVLLHRQRKQKQLRDAEKPVVKPEDLESKMMKDPEHPVLYAPNTTIDELAPAKYDSRNLPPSLQRIVEFLHSGLSMRFWNKRKIHPSKSSFDWNEKDVDRMEKIVQEKKGLPPNYKREDFEGFGPSFANAFGELENKIEGGKPDAAGKLHPLAVPLGGGVHHHISGGAATVHDDPNVHASSFMGRPDSIGLPTHNLQIQVPKQRDGAEATRSGASLRQHDVSGDRKRTSTDPQSDPLSSATGSATNTLDAHPSIPGVVPSTIDPVQDELATWEREMDPEDIRLKKQRERAEILAAKEIYDREHRVKSLKLGAKTINIPVGQIGVKMRDTKEAVAQSIKEIASKPLKKKDKKKNGVTSEDTRESNLSGDARSSDTASPPLSPSTAAAAATKRPGGILKTSPTSPSPQNASFNAASLDDFVPSEPVKPSLLDPLKRRMSFNETLVALHAALKPDRVIEEANLDPRTGLPYPSRNLETIEKAPMDAEHQAESTLMQLHDAAQRKSIKLTPKANPLDRIRLETRSDSKSDSRMDSKPELNPGYGPVSQSFYPTD